MSRLKTLLLATALIATPALAQQKAEPAGGPDIVVTATTLKDAQAALAACIAQRCAPDKDIDATLAVAETQFVAGDYKNARETMLASIGRNKRFAGAYPVPVSDLLRAHSRVAVHLGEQDAYFNSALDVVTALKAGLDNDDYRVLSAKVELADAYAKTKRVDAALELYRAVARRAQDLHLPKIEGYALLREVTVLAANSFVPDDMNYSSAVAAAKALSVKTDPAILPYAEAAKVVSLKLGLRRDDPAAVDALVARYRPTDPHSTLPVLLYAPKIELPESNTRGGKSFETISLAQFDIVDDQWVDIAFEIAPDGKVANLEIVRKSPKFAGNWVKPILDAIAGRRYAPIAANNPSAQRVERFSFTASWMEGTGTHLRVRSPSPRIESVDLSRDLEPPVPASRIDPRKPEAVARVSRPLSRG